MERDATIRSFGNCKIAIYTDDGPSRCDAMLCNVRRISRLKWWNLLISSRPIELGEGRVHAGECF
jgi:hypothetical protein